MSEIARQICAILGFVLFIGDLIYVALFWVPPEDRR